MERTLVQMDDPIFMPSVAKIANLSFTVIPPGAMGTVELYIGSKSATSGAKNFVSTGSAQSISLPVTMPTAPGVYHVYIDVVIGSILAGAYQATEDIFIIGVTVGPITWA